MQKCQRKSLQNHKVQDTMFSSSFENKCNYHSPCMLSATTKVKHLVPINSSLLESADLEIVGLY